MNSSIRPIAFKSACLIGIALAGCSHALPPAPAPEHRTALAEVDSLRDDLQAAKTNQVDVTAPDSFNRATAYFQQAQRQFSDEELIADVLVPIKYSRAYLNQANNQSVLVKAMLPEVTHAREQALDAGAGRLLNDQAASRMEKADTLLKDLSRGILSNHEPSDSEIRVLAAQYRSLELDSIKQNKLAALQEKLGRAEREQASIFTPLTYELAIRRTNAAEALIEKDRHDRTSIDHAVALANRAADQSIAFMDEARRASDQSPQKIAAELKAKDRAWIKAEEQSESPATPSRQGQMAGVVKDSEVP